MNWRWWLPLAAFAGLAAFLYVQLQQPRSDFVQSAMVGEPMPDFILPPAVEGTPGIQTSDFRGGGPRLLNIFASWCIPCRAEAPHLEALRDQGVDIIGVAIRDRPEEVAAFLSQYGNPFTRIGADDRSRIQIELGSSGVPETFVVDADGVIRYQHIGDIREEHIPLLLRELEKAGR